MAPSKRPNSSSGSKLKQGNLFSFFSKKPAAKAPARAPASQPSNDANASAKPAAASASSKPAAKELWQQVSIGTRVEVYWPDDKTYYAATVTGQPQRSNADKSVFTLSYDDMNEVERVDLATEQFRLLKEKPASSKKKRRIQEDSEEEEFEFEETASEGGEESAYEHDAAAHESDDEEEVNEWMVTDDEEGTPKPSSKKKKASFKVTQVKSSSKPAAKKPKSSVTTPTQPTSKPTVTPSERRMSPVLPKGAALPYVKQALNPAGSHVHNHLKFLQNPKDSQRRTKDDPNYDSHTLWVDYREVEGHQKVTQANRQWWEIKSQYADTVLLFKTGKFYELYHMDADVGVNVLDFTYMKGHVAHAGFPEVSYGVMAERLVKAGYKVARVEQTETPDALKERKKKKRPGVPTPQVVNREVCSVLTRGTRTFCYLDDANALSTMESNSSVGPLLAIREILLSQSADDAMNDNDVQPVCEYGVTIVDAVRATVTIGQFADDVLRSRMNTLLAAFEPSEILIEGGENGASPVLQSLLKSVQSTSRQGMGMERIQPTEKFPKSNALDSDARRKMERKSPTVHPWDVKETLDELHRRGYYPRASRQQQDADQLSTSRWPKVLQAAVEGNAELALSSFGAVLFYLQRNLIDQDILGMGIVKAYVPPSSSGTTKASSIPVMTTLVTQQERKEDGVELSQPEASSTQAKAPPVEFESDESILQEREINHMALDGTTLQNLEVLFNSQTYSASGSLWSKINFAKTPHGSRLLRAWLLRPLFRKEDIERRGDAVEELVSGAAAVAIEEARKDLSQCGDIERLLSRIHSMGGPGGATASDDNAARYHPNERAVLYEGATHTKRKVEDFSKVLNYLQAVSRIPDRFEGVEIQSPLLQKLVRFIGEEDGGCFPDMTNQLDWFFENFDVKEAAAGLFEPSRGVDEEYDQACDAIERIERELGDYKDEMCSTELKPAHVARSKWKYINTKVDSKDKYLIELPASVHVPADFHVKGKRGKDAKKVNKYRTPVVERLVQQLEHALDVQREGKARGMQLIFSKFDSMRNSWSAAAQATALLDALGSLAQASSRPGYTRPKILDCPPGAMPSIRVVQGRHPCVDSTHSGGDFIPNDLVLGEAAERVLLLSGPNMGGKSTLLRQTCLLAILAQVGCFVPAAECALTPVDRIYTRLGASDRILQGQSTFFLELAETASALRGATRRSLVITDEFGRGTSTFDGTALASAAVKHLVDRNKCLALFATHYHSVLDEWKEEPSVRLGHMECLVEGSNPVAADDGNEEAEDGSDHNITFLYTLGEGACPKSFGINVARLAGLPEEILSKAQKVSTSFEAELTGADDTSAPDDGAVSTVSQRVVDAIQSGNFEEAENIWRSLQ